MARTKQEVAEVENYYNSDKMISEDVAAEITSLEDWERVTGTALVDINDVIPGFSVVDKSELIGKPLILLGWRINDSNKFSDADGHMLQFASVLVRDLEGKRTVVFNDGGTGIPNQLSLLEGKGVRGGVSIPNGLRVSEYVYIADNGSSLMASTHYLSN